MTLYLDESDWEFPHKEDMFWKHVTEIIIFKDGIFVRISDYCSDKDKKNHGGYEFFWFGYSNEKYTKYTSLTHWLGVYKWYNTPEKIRKRIAETNQMINDLNDQNMALKRALEHLEKKGYIEPQKVGKFLL